MKLNLSPKLLIILLMVSIIPILLTAYIGISDINNFERKIITNLEQISDNTIIDNSRIIEDLSEKMIEQKAKDVAGQIEIYLATHPQKTIKDLQNDENFKKIAIQPVGETGYTAIQQYLAIKDKVSAINRFHINSKLVNTDLSSFSQSLPQFWKIMEKSISNRESCGYYDWKESDGKLRKKYMFILPIKVKTKDGASLGLAATTYIDEFYEPVFNIQAKLHGAFGAVKEQLAKMLAEIYYRDLGIILAIILVAILTTTLFAKHITEPVKKLTQEINRYTIGYKDISVEVRAHDEIGQLAKSFLRMVKTLNREYENIRENYVGLLASLAKIMEAKDIYTRDHTERVTEYSIKIARYMGLPEEEIEILRQATLIHDIGKIGIKEEILNKPATLTTEEFELVKTHPVTGVNILRPIKFLENTLPLVRHHHERVDGKGYPDGLEDDDIPLGARIIAVADAFDAMTSDRPYRKAMPETKALSELIACSGTQFDPDVVEALIAAFKQENEESTQGRNEK